METTTPPKKRTFASLPIPPKSLVLSSKRLPPAPPAPTLNDLLDAARKSLQSLHDLLSGPALLSKRTESENASRSPVSEQKPRATGFEFTSSDKKLIKHECKLVIPQRAGRSAPTDSSRPMPGIKPVVLFRTPADRRRRCCLFLGGISEEDADECLTRDIAGDVTDFVILGEEDEQKGEDCSDHKHAVVSTFEDRRKKSRSRVYMAGPRKELKMTPVVEGRSIEEFDESSFLTPPSRSRRASFEEGVDEGKCDDELHK